MPMKKYQPFKSELTKLGELANTPDLIDQLQAKETNQEITVYSDPDLGFLAVKPVTRANQLTLFVWVAISRLPNGIVTVLPMLEQMARETGCSAIEFETTRKGFKRVARNIGFVPIGQREIFTIYRKEV